MAGLIHSDNNPDRVTVSDDVRLSLRYLPPGHRIDVIDPVE